MDERAAQHRAETSRPWAGSSTASGCGPSSATAAAPATAAIAHTTFSPDGRTLATIGFQDKTIHLWRLV